MTLILTPKNTGTEVEAGVEVKAEKKKENPETIKGIVLEKNIVGYYHYMHVK